VKRFTKIALLSIALLLVAMPTLAQAAEAGAGAESLRYFIYLGRTFGTALVIIGAAYGISRIGAAAVENMARQPEVAGNIQLAMIIAAALIEGITFFALIICMMELRA
jgi:F-type H+-transporting ATPase subunit c